LKCWE